MHASKSELKFHCRLCEVVKRAAGKWKKLFIERKENELFMSIKLFILEQSRLATAGKRFFLSKASKRNLRTRQFVDNISKQNFCFDEEFFAGNN